VNNPVASIVLVHATSLEYFNGIQQLEQETIFYHKSSYICCQIQ